MMDKRCVVRRLRCPECTLLGRVCRGAVSRPPPFSRLRCPRTHGKWPNRKIPQLFITFTTRSTHHGAHLQYTPHTSPQSAVATQSAAQSRPLCRVPGRQCRLCRSASAGQRSVPTVLLFIHAVSGFSQRRAVSGFSVFQHCTLYVEPPRTAGVTDNPRPPPLSREQLIA